MTLKNNRAPLLTYFKLCTSFCSHWWIQTGVTVRKCQIWVKIGSSLSPVTSKFDRWPWITTLHLFYATSSYVHHFVAICEFKLELWSIKAQIEAKFALTSVTLTFDLDLLHGHHFCPWQFFLKISWYDDRNIVKMVWKTDGQTDWTIHRAAWSQLKILAARLNLFTSGILNLSESRNEKVQ